MNREDFDKLHTGSKTAWFIYHNPQRMPVNVDISYLDDTKCVVQWGNGYASIMENNELPDGYAVATTRRNGSLIRCMIAEIQNIKREIEKGSEKRAYIMEAIHCCGHNDPLLDEIIRTIQKRRG